MLEHQGLIEGVQFGNKKQQKPCPAKACGIAGVQRAVNNFFWLQGCSLQATSRAQVTQSCLGAWAVEVKSGFCSSAPFPVSRVACCRGIECQLGGELWGAEVFWGGKQQEPLGSFNGTEDASAGSATGARRGCPGPSLQMLDEEREEGCVGKAAGWLQ